VLSGHGQGWRLGWGVLASRGMAAWTIAQQQIPVVPQQNPRDHADQDAVALPAHAAELVPVLASMALAHLRPGRDQPASERGEDREHQLRQRGGQGHPRAPAA
jgi:hypothetical protein